jgi:glycosyltransferase involved in cell wall biosynthesis
MGMLGWEVVGLETAGDDDTYAWDESSARDDGPRVVTVFKARKYDDLGKQEMRRGLGRLLEELKPDAIAIAGWSLTDSSSCLDWCKSNGSLAIVMSETREADGHRVGWKEFLKSRVIRRFDAALVGGKTHRDYLVKLGMPAARIAFGYNVVDNTYFKAESRKWKAESAKRQEGPRRITEEEVESDRRAELEGQSSGNSFQLSEFQLSAFPPRYFLASNRFIERKNLARLIEAYAEYLKRGQESGARGQRNPEPGIKNQEHRPWDLCLLGDGELKASLVAQCHALGLTVIESAPWETAPTPDSRPAISVLRPPSSDLRPPSSGSVFFPGFRQIEELPRFYAHAGCFVHPALEEPWGLVLNEAMACSLPVLSGNNVGAAEELIDQGVNGWTFDAESSAEMAECLQRIAGLNDGDRTAMGAASARILEERCPTEAFGRGLAELLQDHKL